MEAESSDDILGSKKLNYDFLLLVRDKKYPQALCLGKKILALNPDNPAVLKFCSFIQKNNSQLTKMVQKQKQQEDYESVDSDDQDNQQQQEEQQVEGQQKQSQSENSDQPEEQQQQQQEEETVKQKKQKIQLTTCTLNQIPHICPRHHKQLAKQKIQTQKTQSTYGQNKQQKQNINA